RPSERSERFEPVVRLALPGELREIIMVFQFWLWININFIFFLKQTYDLLNVRPGVSRFDLMFH
ncbi:hypothetical protein, partial [Stutzerimonas zhaodongensis]|uniref:hypothetical protein n=1 Tax=Stutzerimonas zhaodongensis TaxID=1176257 RepID=UPI001ABFA6F9